MTIDEAIAHAREVASEQKRRSGICAQNNSECDKFSACLKCSEEHEQLAEWLEELKDYRDKNKMVVRIDCANSDEFKDMAVKLAKEQYNKAIDDFVKLAKEHNWNIRNRNENEFIYGAIDRLAEQLKEGGENESSN